MKKVLSVFLVALMLFAMIPTTVFAANAPAITATADKTTVKVGDVVTVTVKAPANSNLVAFTYTLKYNTSYFQLVDGSVKTNGIFPSEMMNSSVAGEIRYIGATGTKVTAAGNLFTVKFKILKTGGKITCDIKEAYIVSGETDIDVTSACAAASTKSISFSATAAVDYFAIKAPSETTISYKNGIILHVNEKKAKPANTSYKWTANNENFVLEPSEDGKSCTIISSASGDTTITVELVNASGKVLDKDTVVMTSKAGFFDKLIAFFRSIFSGNKILPN